MELYRILFESSRAHLRGRVDRIRAWSCAFIYIAAPFFDEIYRRIPQKIARIICVVLLLLFAVDIVYSLIHPNSGAGITDYHVHAGEVLSLLCL